ncbi:hypothetical protein D1007_41181 [Hordeum vulgare]|nr:hypothetical protein D1007_41181 [Hordeum vulgare]
MRREAERGAQSLFISSFAPGFTYPMVDAHHVCAECRSVRVMVTAPAGPGTRRYSAGAEDAATDPAAREQQASSMLPSMQRVGYTTAASSSHSHLEQVHAQATLLMARKLLRYRR